MKSTTLGWTQVQISLPSRYLLQQLCSSLRRHQAISVGRITGTPKDFTCHEVVQLVITCGFCNKIKDCIVQIQQQANLREGKVLWGTQQVDYIGPMAHTSEGWKFIMTGVEIVSSLDNAFPTCTTSRFGLSCGRIKLMTCYAAVVG